MDQAPYKIMTVYKIKNISGSDGTWAGQEILDGETYILSESEIELFRLSTEVFSGIASQDLLVEGDTGTFPDPIEGWDYFSGNHLPISEIDGKKLAVHSSPKPYVPGKTSYVMWTSCGDDIGEEDIGDGPMVQFESEIGTAEKYVDVKFLPTAGRIWIHEGYLKFEGGGIGDYISSDVRAEATQLQQAVDLDLELDGDWVKFADGGAGTGTHGFAATPVLVPRSFSHDGYWDWDGVTLTPNALQQGDYHISSVERIVHRYINKIPCMGSSYGYFTMSSDETAEIPLGYYVRVSQHNVSNTEWTASVIMEIYRERTHDP